jgi:hypothetical protein
MLVIFSYLQWFMSEFYLVWSICKEGNGIGPIYVPNLGLVCLLSNPLYQTWHRNVSFVKNYILEWVPLQSGLTRSNNAQIWSWVQRWHYGYKFKELFNYLYLSWIRIEWDSSAHQTPPRVIPTSFGCQNNPYSCYLGWTLLGWNQMQYCRGPFNCFDEAYLLESSLFLSMFLHIIKDVN